MSVFAHVFVSGHFCRIPTKLCKMQIKWTYHHFKLSFDPESRWTDYSPIDASLRAELQMRLDSVTQWIISANTSYRLTRASTCTPLQASTGWLFDRKLYTCKIYQVIFFTVECLVPRSAKQETLMKADKKFPFTWFKKHSLKLMDCFPATQHM